MLQPLVLVVGATGRTGGSIVDALLRSGNFRVAVTVRPASAQKPVVAELRARGVVIREVDALQPSNAEELKAALASVDVLISTVSAEAITKQRSLFVAAKEVGVKRVIPCDFGTPGARGVRALHDEKLDIREFLEPLGVGYTFIDVGWWMELSLPYKLGSNSPIASWSRDVYGTGDLKFLVTTFRHIGDYVAKIIADERTLNKYVIVWEDEVTQVEAKDIGERVSGDGQALKEKRTFISPEKLAEHIDLAKEEWLKGNPATHSPSRSWYEYQDSMHLKGENTLVNAKALGALDVRELYPDVAPTTLEEFAETFYKPDWSL